MTGPSEHVDVDDLARLIETLQGVIRHHGEAIGSFEYRTRMLLVVPLLNALGWDTADPAMVIPDYRVGNGQVDYALFGPGQGVRGRRPVAFIDVKPLGTEIVDAHRAKALIIANLAGVNYVGITNGDHWELYDAIDQSLIVDQCILTISIRHQDAFICARELLAAFSRLAMPSAWSTTERPKLGIRTYYDELSVEPSATFVEIRKAYLQRVREVHPDVSKRSQANRETARLNQIYEILSNEPLRRQYDAILRSRNPGAGGGRSQRRGSRAETTGNTNDEKGQTQSNRSSHGSGPAQSGRDPSQAGKSSREPARSEKRPGRRNRHQQSRGEKRRTRSNRPGHGMGPPRSARTSSRSRKGPNQSASGSTRPRSRPPNWPTKRGPGFWQKAKWLAVRLLVLAVLVTVALVGYHAYSGSPLGPAIDMMTEDYRVAAACPTDPGTVLDFVRRPPYRDNRTNMSVRHSEGWVTQVCNGDLAYEQPPKYDEREQPVQVVAAVTEESEPDIVSTATPSIRSATETPASHASPTPASGEEQSAPPPPNQATPSPITALTDAATITPTPHPTPVSTPANTLKLSIPPTVVLPPIIAPVATLAVPATVAPIPTLAPLPIPTVILVPTAALLPTLAPAPTASPSPTVAPVPTATLPPTVAPTPTPVPPPPTRHLEEKQFMLKLINDERVSAGLNPVVLGDNAAAQLHAEASLENCFSSHWGIDGLKPYMRYSLAGGYQSNGENASGLGYCIKASDGYRQNSSAKQEILEAMEGLMDSPGHRDNILDPWHRKINIGLAWDRYNFKVIQHFEGDHVEYAQLPFIENGVLRISGTVKNGAQFDNSLYSGVQVYYDQPPQSLSKGQVGRTYCYDNGLLVASLRQPLTGGWFYDEDEFIQTHLPCPDPYDVSPNARAAQSHNEAHSIWLAAYGESLTRQPRTITVPRITAQTWTVKSKEFSVAADLSQVLAKHGDGVYTLVVWGGIDGEDSVISEYSIFHGVTPPDAYDAYKYEGG